MAKNENRRLTPNEVAKDLEIYGALKDIAGYAPANADYSLPSLQTKHTTLTAAQDASAQADATAATKRDILVDAQWDFHNGILGAKASVIAQFSPNSNEVQAVQLKKKTEYKPRTRKPKPPKP
jgi:hypothetical protein